MGATLMSTLELHRAERQRGGFNNQMLQFGFHSVTTWAHILETNGPSTAVLDLTSAFNHLVRLGRFKHFKRG